MASSSESPDHLKTNIASGQFHEPDDLINEKDKGPTPEDEEEDEDIDALIAELESEDGDEEEEDEETPGMSARPIPEELLNTDPRKGLTPHEVIERRKKYGLNQMAEEKENLIKKFLMYFVGPIQFVMEVTTI
jgi:H+-transporting ATPase